VQVVGGRLVAFDRPVQTAPAAIQQECAAALGIHGAVFARDVAAEQVIDALLGNPPVNHVDHAADGIRAVEQRRRAAHDFDAPGEHRIEAHGVVGARRRGVNRVAAILQHTDAVPVETADDRTARRRAEVGGTDAGCARERLAERGLERALEAISGEDGNRLRLLEERAPEGRRVDDGFFQTNHSGCVGGLILGVRRGAREDCDYE